MDVVSDFIMLGENLLAYQFTFTGCLCQLSVGFGHHLLHPCLHRPFAFIAGRHHRSRLLRIAVRSYLPLALHSQRTIYCCSIHLRFPYTGAQALDPMLASFHKASHPFLTGSDPAFASSCPESSYSFASYFPVFSVSDHGTGGPDAAAH